MAPAGVRDQKVDARALRRFRRLCLEPAEPPVHQRLRIALGLSLRLPVGAEEDPPDFFRGDHGRGCHLELLHARGSFSLLVAHHPHAFPLVAAPPLVVHAQDPVLAHHTSDHLLDEADRVLTLHVKVGMLEQSLQVAEDGTWPPAGQHVTTTPAEAKLHHHLEVMERHCCSGPDLLAQMHQRLQRPRNGSHATSPKLCVVYPRGGRYLIACIETHLWNPQLAAEDPVEVHWMWPAAAERQPLHGLAKRKEIWLRNKSRDVSTGPNKVPPNSVLALKHRPQLPWIEPPQLSCRPNEDGAHFVVSG
mmetsp:Transcript_37261/g.106443  ORF Transcript_37261/g.106443 Transcript_37261/m.106443 type:complete len:304 (-) Transcript_37261:296-1207(-)